MHKIINALLGLSAFLVTASAAPGPGKADHIVVVVWDGMRPDFISEEHTPTLFQLAKDGVTFAKHHAVFCTSTEVNGTAIATGAYPGHSGIIANTMYLPAIDPLNPVSTQALESIRKGDQISGGHYLLRPTVPEMLQKAGLKTIVVGTKAVALLHDRNEQTNGTPMGVNVYNGRAFPESVMGSIEMRLGPFPAKADSAQRNRWSTHALLGPLWQSGVPAYSLLWLSEPDATQHATGPGSEESLAAMEHSDDQLSVIISELKARQIFDKTDIFVVSDHGFSTTKSAVNVAALLSTNGFSATRSFKSVPKKGDVLVVGQGGAVLFYVIGRDDRIITKLVDFLQQQEFTGVLFANKDIKGTFSLEKANINCPNPPDVVLSMRWTAEKNAVGTPGLAYSDGGKAGHGHHASLSRFDTHNTLVAAGPDLKTGFTDSLPTANTDLAPTILWLFGVKPAVPMDGRILSEALTVDAPKPDKPVTRRLEATRKAKAFTWKQYLQISEVKGTVYLDEGNGESQQSH